MRFVRWRCGDALRVATVDAARPAVSFGREDQHVLVRKNGRLIDEGIACAAHLFDYLISRELVVGGRTDREIAPMPIDDRDTSAALERAFESLEIRQATIDMMVGVDEERPTPASRTGDPR